MPIPNTNSLGYQGLKERDPPDIFFRDRDPTVTDYKLYDVIDLWQNNTTKDLFVLISKEGNVALWVKIATTSTGSLASINGVAPVATNINLVDLGAVDITTGVGVVNLAVKVDGVTIQIVGDQLTVPSTGAFSTLNGVSPVANNINLVDLGAVDITTGVGVVNLAVKVDGTTIGIVGDQLTVLGSSGFTWVETAVGLTMTVNTGYIANGGVLLNLILPAVAAQGSEIRIAGKGVGGWRMTANAGQTIYMGNKTTAVGGNLASTHQRDCVHVVCITANSEWQVLDGVGNLVVT